MAGFGWVSDRDPRYPAYCPGNQENEEEEEDDDDGS
jgi:hypothetical protein